MSAGIAIVRFTALYGGVLAIAYAVADDSRWLGLIGALALGFYVGFSEKGDESNDMA